jgi:hypothetical protein
MSIDWKAVCGTIDLAFAATNLLCPAPGRRGERGKKLWWCSRTVGGVTQREESLRILLAHPDARD